MIFLLNANDFFSPYIFIQKQFYACKCEQRHQVVRLFFPKALRMCPTWAINTKGKKRSNFASWGWTFVCIFTSNNMFNARFNAKIHFRCRKVALLASKFCETIKDRSVWSIHNMNICVLLCLWLMRIGCHKKWWYFCSFLRSFVCLLFVCLFFFIFRFTKRKNARVCKYKKGIKIQVVRASDRMLVINSA